MPAYSTVRAATDGNIWVAEFQPPGVTRQEWLVFDGTGRLIARFETPVDLQVYQIGPDFILGRTVDDNGVERVLSYAYGRDDHLNDG